MSRKINLFQSVGLGGGMPATTHEFICLIPRIPLSALLVKTFNLPSIEQSFLEIPYKGDSLLIPDLYNIKTAGEIPVTFYESASHGVKFETLMTMLHQMISFNTLFDMYITPIQQSIPSSSVTVLKDCFVRNYSSMAYNMSTPTQHMERTLNIIYNNIVELVTPADSHVVRSTILAVATKLT